MSHRRDTHPEKGEDVGKTFKVIVPSVMTVRLVAGGGMLRQVEHNKH